MERGGCRSCKVGLLAMLSMLHFENKVLNPSPRLNEGARAAREAAIAEDLGRRTAEAQTREALLRANEAEAMLARSDQCFVLARFWQLLCVSKIKYRYFFPFFVF